MKHVVTALAVLFSITACQELQAPVAFNPASQQIPTFGAFNTSNNLHHPDFVRKLRNPAQYRVQPSMNNLSICGPKNDLQHINDYDGKLGPSVEYANQFETAVGAIANGTNPKDSKFCSGTLISEDLFLTANHCVDSSITKGKAVVFNYEKAKGNSNLLEQDPYKVVELVEEGASLDYAIVRLEGKPGLKHGFNKIRAIQPEKGQPLIIIQHPKGQPKQIESGPIQGNSGDYITYSDLDTEPGSSGSGVLDKDGFLVGVHTNGGCGSQGGTNKGVNMVEILKASKIVQSLNQANRMVRR